MGDLTKNLNRSEFACQGECCCGHSAPVERDLYEGVQKLRDLVGRPLRVSSGFRCITHNSRTPDAEPNSYHTMGMAADIMCPPGVTPAQLARLAESVPAFAKGGIGTYPNRIHVDVRPNGPARWSR